MEKTTQTIQTGKQKSTVSNGEPDALPPMDPPQEKPKTPQNPWMVASAVLLGLLIAGAVLGYMQYRKMMQRQSAVVPSPTLPAVSSPTAAVTPTGAITGWLTYTNAKHSFAADYPNTWRVREFPDTANGAGFSPLTKPNEPASESISVSAVRQIAGDTPLSFDEYAKVAATHEIQNYTKLATIKKIVTNDGVTGYETTWMVQPLMGQGGAASESLPITYFNLPGTVPATVQYVLNTKDDLAVYEAMLVRFRLLAKPSPPPTVDDRSLIRSALIKAYNWDPNTSVDVTISTNDGTYASGTASNGYFFAKKVNGAWEIVAAGNGVITCASMKKYPDYPKTLIPECYDETTQKSVKR